MIQFLSSTAIINELDREDSSARKKLLSEGWQENKMRAETYCASKSGHEEARVFTRTISLDVKYPEYFARRPVNNVQKNAMLNNNVSNNPNDTKALDTGSKSTIGPDENDSRPHDNELSCIHSMLDLPSVKAMRSNKDSLVIALDTEFFYYENDRLILSYQFAFYDPNNHNVVHQCVFFPAVKKRLPFWRMISWILTRYNLCEAYDFRLTRRWRATVKKGNVISHKTFKSPKEAYEASILDEEKELFFEQFDEDSPFRSKNRGQDCGYFNDYSDFHKIGIIKDITLICHFGSADLSTFEIPHYDNDNETDKKDILDVLAKCSYVQGGLVSISPSYEHPKVIKKWWKFYPIRFYVRDTMCFAPAGQKSLKNLGESIYVHKLELPYEAINHMDKYFSVDPVNYLEYAINDSVICLLYSSELWGVNKHMEITATSGAAKASLPVIKNHFGVFYDKDLDLHYRGLQKKSTGKRLTSTPDGPKGFTEDTYYEPVSDDASLIINAAANAYAGGFNGCLGARYVNSLTHDFDLQNAYPTSMSCITDPDWGNYKSLISNTIEKRLLTLQDFNSPYDLMFGDIDFEFPDNVLFPCIPVNVNGSVIFPRTSKGLTKCYASAPEIYLALHLGAKITARRVYIASKKIMPDGSPSRCLYKVCEQFVHDRNLAKSKWGSTSFEQSFLKVAINSIYGKTAQNIKPKSSWNAARAEMEDIGWSSLTSPVHACLTTSGIRAILNAAMNQLSNLGYKCYSVTTDGFITDAALDVLNNLDLYGFSEYFREARMRLTGSRDMWEEKHTNTSFLNISTRGNVSQDLANDDKKAGVCAHNGFRPFFIDPDDGEVIMQTNGALDRYVTMTAVAQRTGRVCSPEKRFTGFKELSYHGIRLEKRKDFTLKHGKRNLRMDYDIKRKPLESSFEQVFLTVKGVTEEVSVKGSLKKITVPDVHNCEWMNFDSVPYDSVAEYEAYRRIYDNMDCLRTKADWDKFWLKIHSLSSNKVHKRHITDVSWTILISCVMGHRLGFWNIPALSDPEKTVDEKVAWINQFNTSSKKFTTSSWKNCRRPDRISQMVSEDDCRELLEQMTKLI